ncbi:MAG: hypothetical protein UHZ05_08590, partial [Acutalibacteraceae bacterium]|nr:hypothetical protein [Acutalibacteraceae bacterium]
ATPLCLLPSPARYTLTPTRHRTVIYCNKCGGVTDVYPNLPDLRKAEEDKGYEVTNYSLMYSGVCENCRK